VIAGDQVVSYAVVGNPVTHSLSPRIHASFAEQTGQALSYSAIEIPLDDFAAGIRSLQNQGFGGVNVTVPFKREAWELCDNLSARAEQAGAANTLSFMPDGSIAGDNTDGIGLLRDLLENLKLEVSRREVLVLGAGGAVRGVLGPLLEQSPAGLTLANRSPDKAIALARDFRRPGQRSTRYPGIDRSRSHGLLRHDVRPESRYRLRRLGSVMWRGQGRRRSRHAGGTGSGSL
jgi:shikimate dehydrogenase